MEVTRAEFDILVAEVKLLTGQINNTLPPPAAAKIVEYDDKFTKTEQKIVEFDGKFAQIEQWKSNFESMTANLTAQHGALANDAKSHVQSLTAGMTAVEQQATSAAGKNSKGGWQMTRAKDLIPSMFDGKEEEWAAWKESVEDYIDKIQPAMKILMKRVSTSKVEITKTVIETDFGHVEGQWDLAADIFSLLKAKTVVGSEARTIVMTSDDSGRENGFEAWRVLTIRFEPQMGIRRMKEVAELSALQNKRCKNATETSLILLDIDRRRKRIAEIGGQDPSNDTLVSVLWMSMDAGSRSHVSGKLNVAEVTYVDCGMHSCSTSA